MMRLATGAIGFVGANLSRRLLAHGHRAVAPDHALNLATN